MKAGAGGLLLNWACAHLQSETKGLCLEEFLYNHSRTLGRRFPKIESHCYNGVISKVGTKPMYKMVLFPQNSYIFPAEDQVILFPDKTSTLSALFTQLIKAIPLNLGLFFPYL